MNQAGFIQNQASRVLANPHVALLSVVVLMLLPYMAWLAMAILALVTLRHGIKHGTQLIIPAFTAHVILLMFSMPLNLALLEGLIRIVPVYLFACALRVSSSWNVVAWVFGLLAFVLILVLQTIVPELIQNQYAVFKSIISQ
ncbi:MAG: hypothetical protein B7X00_02055, partial [Legionella sp. 21-45-4]